MEVLREVWERFYPRALEGDDRAVGVCLRVLEIEARMLGL